MRSHDFFLMSGVNINFVPFQLPVVVQRLRERKWRVGELLHMLLRYCEESQTHSQSREEAHQAGRELHCVPLFQWLLEHA